MRQGSLIAGTTRESSEWIDVLDPATEAVFGAVAKATLEDCIDAVDAAAAALGPWSRTAPRVRGELLRAAFELIRERKQELAETIVRENGKSLGDALGEVDYSAEFFRWFAEEAVRIGGELRLAPGGDKRIMVTKQPIGVALLITPWNFPAAMAARKLAPALAPAARRWSSRRPRPR
jgi:succinate-semialdehyde dehydrogenase/glutarate-semialdehyde dehydrogenase